jgi:diguanylate cyclase (GGDEF)-like protein
VAETTKSIKIKLLKDSELFSSCSTPELEIIAKNSSFLSLDKGSSVFSLGDEGKSLYIIESGEIVISKPVNENRMIEIARFVNGDCFGELDMLTGLPRSASADADTDAKLLVFPKKGMLFKEMLEKYPDVSARILHKFIMQISGRIRKANSLVKENSPLVQELSRQVYRDKLTGLYNKIWLEENLKEIISKQGNKDNLSLIMLKPDNFKAINDAHGHEAGDHALRIISRELGNFLPEEAVLVRYMGNELAVLLPGFGRDDALNMAEKLMEYMHEMDLSAAAGGSPFILSVSFGIALYPEHAAGSEELIQCAHELPLIGRGRGGNIILFPEDKALMGSVK